MSEEAAAIWVPTEDLVPWVDNPRQNDKAVRKIAASIKRFGFGAPIVARRENKEIIAGHTRLKAALQLGLKRVPVRFLDIDPADAHLLAIADNRTAEEAEWDTLKLAEQVKLASEEDLSVLGFSEKELRGILRVEGGEDGEVMELPEEPTTKPGDVWKLGPHRLICGDSTLPETYDRLVLPTELVSLYLTDPPYGVSYDGAGVGDGKTIRKKIDNDELTGDELRDRLLAPAFGQAASKMALGASFYIWFAGTQAGPFVEAAKNLGGHRQLLVWVKDSPVIGRQEFQNKHEPILYGWKPGAAHLSLPDRKQTTVWEFPRPKRSDEHPTMKPVPMFVYAIQMSSSPGSIVLDSFSGSGTTLIACEQTGRVARCVELSPAYCDVIVNRWETMTGKKAELELREEQDQ